MTIARERRRTAGVLVGAALAWSGLAGLAGLALAAGGCAIVVCGGCDSISTVSEERTFGVAHVAGSELDVRSRNGSVTIQKAAGSEVSIHATVRAQTVERLQGVTVIAERVEGGRLAVHAEPPGGDWKSSEGVSFEIKVPDAVGVKVVSSNGGIEIGGLAGLADLDTSNGRVTVKDHDGPVRAHSSNGRIEVERVAGAVNVATSNGRVTVKDAANSVEADTSNGRVEIALADGSAGPVSVETSNGAVELELGPAFVGELDVSTSNGTIQVPASESGSRISVKSLSKRSATLVFGDSRGGEGSTVKTSNGGVTIKAR